MSRRASTLPITLVLGALLAGTLALLLIRLECRTCSGRGDFYRRSLGEKTHVMLCPTCEGAGKESLYRRWTYDPPPGYAR